MIKGEMELPVEVCLPALKKLYQQQSRGILVAPPGAGKTTRVPLALLEEPWLVGRKILMLEPRRLAAKMVANYMASLLGESVGQRVGYRVHLDSRVGVETRIEVVTEGILTRMLQTDPSLEGIGLVIFDEFHERSLHADVGLALCLETQSILREDLKLLIMSATLEVEKIAQLLQAPVIESQGRSYPVEVVYEKQTCQGSVEPLVARKVQELLGLYPAGDILVFLPGEGEIRRVQALLEQAGLEEVRLTPLYGRLSPKEQEIALLPDKQGRRKVILATSIAETSVTVEGVRFVVDSGWQRLPRFSPTTGLTRLETVRASKAAANQRAGRAGRLAPGHCFRLWTEYEQRGLIESTKPEILSADLAPVALELAAWGNVQPEGYTWLDAPPSGTFAQALALLQQLGAIDEKGNITQHGRQLHETGLHPRLAHMLVTARAEGKGRLACRAAVLLSPREVLPEGQREVDFTHLLSFLLAYEQGEARQNRAAYDKTMKRVLQEIHHLERMFSLKESEALDTGEAGQLLARAYPDRVGQNKGNGRFLLQNGRRAVLPESLLVKEEFLVAAHLDDQGAEGRIFLAASLAKEQLEELFSQEIQEETLTFWERETRSVRSRKRKTLGVLLLKEEITTGAPEAVLAALLEGIRQEGLDCLPWNKKSKQLWQRMNFLYKQDASWPDVTEEQLLATLEDWLAPYIYGMKSGAELGKLSMYEILENRLSWEKRQQLDSFAPTHFQVPSGYRAPIDYSKEEGPILAVRLQELFGLSQTPALAGGKIPLLLHLLSPAGRPVQITQDLAGFWQNSYFEVRKDLKGRYPKHRWPEDPLKG